MDKPSGTPRTDAALDGWTDLIVRQSRLIPADAFAKLRDASRQLEADLTAERGRREAAERDARRVEWQPIETAPKDGTAFLAYWERAAIKGCEGYAVISWQDWGGGLMAWFGSTPMGIVLTGATHWQPLPKAPKQSDALLGKGSEGA